MSLLNSLLSMPMDYSDPKSSFSPLFSSYALCAGEDFPGITRLVLNYNRKARDLWAPLCRLPGEMCEYQSRFDHISLRTDCTSAEIAFYDIDSFLLTAKTTQPISFFTTPSPSLADHWVAYRSQTELVIQGFSKNPDGRDPDPQVAVLAGIRAKKGRVSLQKGVCRVFPDENGDILLAFSSSVLNISLPALRKRLAAAPDSPEQARESVLTWARDCMGPTLTLPHREDAKAPFLLAVSGLLMNLTLAPGDLAGHVSSFPNRGDYATHFLWDSAFQNLAYERMNPALARDSFLQLTDNIRSDGRISHFHCSTWGRPTHSQPALTGWMILRYLDEVDPDPALMKEVLPALEANNNWWLTQRATRFGLIYCDDGLETGQDNSPRFDKGPILALDMNSYLVNQMRVTSEIARRLGQKRKAAAWAKAADTHAARMVKYLYDPTQNLFFDADAATGKRQSLISASAFLPLWCGVPLPEEKIHAMITHHMLNPQTMYGDVPFPCVAYDQPCYDAGGWWRGPTWLSLAWLLLEVLKRYGFEKERRDTMLRYYDMMIADGLLHELFHSQTGEGLGNVEQGWTAAIFVRITDELGL